MAVEVVFVPDSFFCCIIIVVVSFFTKPADASKTVGLTYGSANEEQKIETRASWNKWDVIDKVIILGIITLFYIYFLVTGAK